MQFNELIVRIIGMKLENVSGMNSCAFIRIPIIFSMLQNIQYEVPKCAYTDIIVIYQHFNFKQLIFCLQITL